MRAIMFTHPLKFLTIPALTLLVNAFFCSALYAQWSLNNSVMPQGFSLQVNHRTRYEFLDDAFRADQSGQMDVIVFRTLVHGRAQLPAGFTLGGELLDARSLSDNDTALNTTIVNSAELLRGYLEFNRADTFGGKFSFQAGRITMDVGSRRFVSRNGFRNTINNFTGIDFNWHGEGNAARLHLRGFWTLPVFRLPDSPQQLHRNSSMFDEERFNQQFWGLFAAHAVSTLGRGEWFLFGLHEHDTANRPTLNRQLFTPGFRLFKTAAASRIDYEIESAFQIGQSHATLTGARSLNHFAHFHHFAAGYTFAFSGSPRIAVLYDFASGDDNPHDGKNGRFDTLYGSRRFDLGPTGIYGAFSRTNMHLPGVRLNVKPHAAVEASMTYRAHWLASKRDAWSNTGISDPNGQSGRFVGSQFEVSVQWQALPGNLTLEAGYAHLFAGDFIRHAPNAAHGGDANYYYTQAVVNF